jgi:hypothetical protein
MDTGTSQKKMAKEQFELENEVEEDIMKFNEDENDRILDKRMWKTE